MTISLATQFGLAAAVRLESVRCASAFLHPLSGIFGGSQPSRSLNANRAVVARVRRETVAKTYPTVLVMPDGATISVRYPVPRRIIKLPIDVHNCTPEDIKRIRHLRRSRGKVEVDEEITTSFDPMKYLRK